MAGNLKGANLSAMTEGIKKGFIYFFILIFLLILPLINIKKYTFNVIFKINRSRLKYQLFPLNKKTKVFYTFGIVFIASFYTYKTVNIDDFINSRKMYSNFIEENYVNPLEVDIKFPQNKKNLIVLYAESMETTLMSHENSGGWKYSVMPELELIALENLNFSNTDILGGAQATAGTTWTIGGLVSYTAGIPLKIPVGGNEYLNTDAYLPGITSLGDILNKEGYNLVFMFGSDSRFGGRYQYFKKHGNYNIIDLNTVIEQERMREEDKVYWGFEDSRLFEWAKEEILYLDKQKKPFNFNLLTVNTHFEDGWLESSAQENFDTQYENVHAFSSKQISEFIEWIKKQDFYKNTTIVIVGDHHSMQSVGYYEERLEREYERVIFNAIINSSKEPENSKKS